MQKCVALQIADMEIMIANMLNMNTRRLVKSLHIDYGVS